MSWLHGAAEAVGGAIGTFEKALKRERAKKVPTKWGKPAGEAKGALVDVFNPFQVTHGYQARPSGLDYDALRKIAMTMPIVAAIIRTRVNQAAQFAKQPKDDFDSGFQIRLRDRKAKMTKGAQKVADEICEFLMICGKPGSDRELTHDNLNTLIRKLVRDSLIFDQMNMQVVPTLDNKPYEIMAMPAHTMRLSWDPRWNVSHPIASTNRFNNSTGMVVRSVEIPRPDPKAPRYVQVYQNVPIADFNSYELTWGVRNPRTDMEVGEYGYSELEELIGVLTQLASADAYNALIFQQGVMADGVLNFAEGNISKSQIREFVRQWRVNVMGVENTGRLPVLNAPGLQWINFNRMSPRDMEFSKTYDHHFRMACAIFQIDPAEVNYVYGNVGQGSTLNQATSEDKIKTSRDRGLRPIMGLIAQILTDHVVRRFHEDFVLEFTGINPESEAERIEKITKKVTHFITVDEAREEIGREPLGEDKGGDVILNQIWLQDKQGREAAEMGEGMEGAAGPGGPPQEGGEGGDEAEGGGREELMSLLGGGKKGEDQEGGGDEADARKSMTHEWFTL